MRRPSRPRPRDPEPPCCIAPFRPARLRPAITGGGPARRRSSPSSTPIASPSQAGSTILLPHFADPAGRRRGAQDPSGAVSGAPRSTGRLRGGRLAARPRRPRGHRPAGEPGGLRSDRGTGRPAQRPGRPRRIRRGTHRGRRRRPRLAAGRRGVERALRTPGRCPPPDPAELGGVDGSALPVRHLGRPAGPAPRTGGRPGRHVTVDGRSVDPGGGRSPAARRSGGGLRSHGAAPQGTSR